MAPLPNQPPDGRVIIRMLMAAICSGLAYQAIGEVTHGLAGSRPNILIVITDDQGYAQLGRHGHPWLRTPHMDRLYDESTRFSRFLVSPTCSPTRAALMTGRHPMRSGVTHTKYERERIPLNAATLPETLKKAGYATGIFGKWHLGDEEAYQPQNRGFDEAFIHGGAVIGMDYAGSCADAPGNSYFDPVIRHNGSFVKTKGYCTDVFFRAALGWIRRQEQDGNPFFAYIATNAPHGPFIAPAKNASYFRERGMSPDHAGFYGMVENIDENLGEMLARLESWGLLDDTLIIFMSDNGTVQAGADKQGTKVGEDAAGNAMVAFNGGMNGYKGSVSEGGVRVPFFVRWPRKIESNRDIGVPAAHIDLLPTLAEIAGAELPPGLVEGRSLVSLIDGSEAAWPQRYLITHAGRWDPGEEPNDHQWGNFAVRDDRFRFEKNKALYDMHADPRQKHNVILEFPEVAEAMREAYDKWWRETRPMLINESVPLSPTWPFHESYNQQLQREGIPAWEPEPL
ncbi:Arylsulfatase [Pirellulimonas nuda]|uniref:Arylsulfatase n=1 Tax=Pirellulimonas nuda TaxID=2528009 RepID=A0A518DDE2_9BACT|nr:arylsulfatase [Pirellulimonas nuda]QDU89497.1 Arylsulfatase [Pirellulimonas nuda]